MLNEKELEGLKAIKERRGFESRAGYGGLSVEEARWLIALLERAQVEAEGPPRETPRLAVAAGLTRGLIALRASSKAYRLGSSVER